MHVSLAEANETRTALQSIDKLCLKGVKWGSDVASSGNEFHLDIVLGINEWKLISPYKIAKYRTRHNK